MIKDWFFSKSGEVIGPFTLSDAKLYLIKNPNVYGWHPSLIHWKPVGYIDEFSQVLPPVTQGSTFTKEISDLFKAKQERLNHTFTTFSSGINNTALSIEDLEYEISEYKLETQKLPVDVKGVVDKMDSKYVNFKRQLSQIKESVNEANNEVLAVVNDFERRMNSYNVSMPSTTPTTPQKRVESKKPTFHNTIEKANLTEKVKEVILADLFREDELVDEFVDEELAESNQPIQTTAKKESPITNESQQVFQDIPVETPDTVADIAVPVPQSQSQRYYRGVPVDTPDKAKSVNQKPVRQKMYRGVPVLND